MSIRVESPTATIAGRSRTASGLTVALISAVAFGASGALVKPLLDAGWSPDAAVVVRTGVAGIVLLPFALRALLARQHRGHTRPSVRSWATVVPYGLVAIALPQLCYFAAVERIPVGVALLIEYLAPVLLVGVVWARTRRMPALLTLAGAVVSIAGLVLVLDLTASARLDPVGVLWAFGAMLGLAGYFVLSAAPSPDLPPAALASLGLLLAAVALTVLGLVGVLPFTATTTDVVLLGRSLPWWVPMSLIVLVSTALAYMTGIAAAMRLGPRLASFVGLAEVLAAVLISWLLLGQPVSPVQALGGALVVTGVLLVRAERSPIATPPPA